MHKSRIFRFSNNDWRRTTWMYVDSIPNQCPPKNIFIVTSTIQGKILKIPQCKILWYNIEKSIEFLNSFLFILYNMINLPVFVSQLLSWATIDVWHDVVQHLCNHGLNTWIPWVVGVVFAASFAYLLDLCSPNVLGKF